MKFELNPIETGKFSSEVASIAREWECGQAVSACERMASVGRRKSPAFRDFASQEDDWLLAIDIANSCGLFNYGKRLTKVAVLQFPNSPWLQLLQIWDLAADGKLFECQRRLRGVATGWPEEFQPARLALETYNFSFAGWRLSAKRADEAAASSARGDCLAAYILSRAAAYRSEWEVAMRWGERALELAPGWTRARTTLLDSMVATGGIDRAKALISDKPPDARPMFNLELAWAYVFQADNDIDRAIECLRKLLREWNLRSRYQRLAAWQLAVWLMMQGNEKEADELAKQFRLRKMSLFQQKGDGRRKGLLHLPLVSQAHNHCVPTVAAMVAQAQGILASPAEYAKGMETRDGTPMWRMVRFMEAEGFRAYCVRADVKVVEGMIDQGVPLIGSLTGLFSSHVDVICGYDERLQIIHCRDPMHWIGRGFSFEQLTKKYRNSEGLWAFVPAHKADTVQVPADWLDPIGLAVIQLTESCIKGDLARAGEAFRAIPDDHPLSLNRDVIARGIVITPREFERRLERFAEWGDDPQVEHFRSLLMRINSTNAGRIYDLMESRRAKFGSSFVDYVQAQCLMAEHKWGEANQRISDVAEKLPQLEPMWRVFADIKEQIGEYDEAVQAMRNALDISPDDFFLNNRLAELQSGSMPFADRLRHIELLMKEHPYRIEACFTLAEVLAGGGDGLRYEKALLDCIRFYPRIPGTYQQLADWYHYQGRTDLARPVLKTGRILIGEEELPKSNYELQETAGPGSSNAAVPESGPVESGDNKAESRGHAEGDVSCAALTDSEKIQLICSELSDKTFADAESHPVVAELLQQDFRGELGWLDSVRFRSLLIRLALMDFEKQELPIEKRESQLRTALPGKHMPGIPEIYAQSLLQSIGGSPVSVRVAELLLEWLTEHCPNSRTRPHLEFERAWLLEKRGYLNESEKTLEQIITRHPKYAPAWYRKGVVALGRNDISAASDYLKKALEYSPGNEGAIHELTRLAEYTRNGQLYHYRERMAALAPYSTYRRYLAACACGQEKSSVDAALSNLASHEREMGAEAPLLRGRILADFGEFDRAVAEIENVEVTEENRKVISWIRVDALLDKRDFAAALPLLNEMLALSPDDEMVADQLARALRELDPQKAVEFCREKLVAGFAVPIFAYVVLSAEADPARAAQELVAQVEPRRRDTVATACADALDTEALSASFVPFLEWITEACPHRIDLRERLANRLQLIGQNRKAGDIAEALLQLNPDDPRWLRLAGYCVQDYDTQKSVEYLEREYALTGNASTLCRLARGHQLLENSEKAIELYFQTLRLNPFDSLAITNLVYKYQICTPELLDQSVRIIELGNGAHDQYFLVVTINLAKRLGRKVPTAWFDAALERLKNLKMDGGFQDESFRLHRALTAWAAKRPGARSQYPASLYRRLLARFVWPGLNWIPAEVRSSH